MGEALYRWPVKVWFCDYCDRSCGVGEQQPDQCPHCFQWSMSATEAAPSSIGRMTEDRVAEVRENAILALAKHVDLDPNDEYSRRDLERGLDAARAALAGVYGEKTGWRHLDDGSPCSGPQTCERLNPAGDVEALREALEGLEFQQAVTDGDLVCARRIVLSALSRVPASGEQPERYVDRLLRHAREADAREQPRGGRMAEPLEPWKLSDHLLIQECRDYLRSYEDSGFSGHRNMAELVGEALNRLEKDNEEPAGSGS